jgi:hypothetical protein
MFSTAIVAASVWGSAPALRSGFVPLDHCELEEYHAPVKVEGKRVIGAVQFLKLRPREMVLVHAKGVSLPKACEDNRIPYRIVKGLYLQVDSSLISSSRNCVAVKRAHLGRLKKAVGERSVSATSTRGTSHRRPMAGTMSGR